MKSIADGGGVDIRVPASSPKREDIRRTPELRSRIARLFESKGGPVSLRAPEITEDDFMSGLLAAFTERRLRAVSIRGDEFYQAMVDSFEKLDAMSTDLGLDVRFYVALDPLYGDSPIIREAISTAVQKNLISLDNPEYQDMRIKLSAEEATTILDRLPGGGDLYRKLADAFLANYSAVSI